MPSIKLETLEDGRIRLSGGTFPIKDQIRARGGRWDPAARVWTLPAGTDLAFAGLDKIAEDRALCDRIAAEWAAKRAEEARKMEELIAYYRASGLAKVAPSIPTRRGPCCSKAETFWPSTDPYAHYGPCHYRCATHGESRDTYTGT